MNRIVFSFLALFLLANCAAGDVDEPVQSQEDALKPECTETYDCGTPTAPRTCCRCWYNPGPWCGGPWDPSCYSGICTL